MDLTQPGHHLPGNRWSVKLVTNQSHSRYRVQEKQSVLMDDGRVKVLAETHEPVVYIICDFTEATARGSKIETKRAHRSSDRDLVPA